MFITINFRALTNPEFQQFIKLLVEKATEAGVDALKIKSPHDLLVANLQKLESALNQEKANEETKIIQALDGERDDYYVGLSFLVNGFALAKDPAKKEAAQLVRLFLKSQGKNVARQNYQAETAILNNVVKTLGTEAKYTAAMTTLGLQSWVTDIDTANQAFEARFKSRNTSLSLDDAGPAFGELRKESMPLIERFFGLITSRYNTAVEDAQPTQGYQNLINEINTLIESFIPYTLPKNKDDKNPTPPAP